MKRLAVRKGLWLSVGTVVVIVGLAAAGIVASLGCGGAGLTGGLTPARNLTGTWLSSLPGRGVVWTADCVTRPCRWYTDVELRLVQSGNNLTGSLRLHNCTYEVLIDDLAEFCECFDDNDEPVPRTVAITDGSISGTRFTFRTATWTWSGSFTTDFMEGTIHYPHELDDAGVGVAGEFDLQRQG